MVSEDRKQEGLALTLSIAENMTLTRLSPYVRNGVFSPGQRDQAVAGWIARMGIACRNAQQPIDSLSGGNQQKVAFARLLHHEADLLLLDEPTRGIDVGSKSQIYRLIGEAAAAGKGVLVISSYLPELFGICDRLAVMRRGILSPVRPISEWNDESVMQFACAAG
jgi:ribose transport system ATP-binding protein